MEQSVSKAVDTKSVAKSSSKIKYFGYAQASSDPWQVRTVEWKPGGNNVGFLVDRVASQASFETADISDMQYFRATFFKDFPGFETIVEARLWNDLLSLKEVVGDDTKKWITFGRPIAGIVGGASWGDATQSDFDDQDLKEVSQVIRKSNTLKHRDGIPVSDAMIFADKGGIGVIAPSNLAKPQFERYLICQMLMIACEDVLARTSTKLSRMISIEAADVTISKLLREYQDFLQFIFASFTEYPVDRKSLAVYEVWELMKSHNKLGATYSEIERQLRAVAQFLQAEESRKLILHQNELMKAERHRAEVEKEERLKDDLARKRDEKFQKRSAKRQGRVGMLVTLFGLLIALISIPDPIRLELCDRFSEGFSEYSQAFDLVCAGSSSNT